MPNGDVATVSCYTLRLIAWLTFDCEWSAREELKTWRESDDERRTVWKDGRDSERRHTRQSRISAKKKNTSKKAIERNFLIFSLAHNRSPSQRTFYNICIFLDISLSLRFSCRSRSRQLLLLRWFFSCLTKRVDASGPIDIIDNDLMFADNSAAARWGRRGGWREKINNEMFHPTYWNDLEFEILCKHFVSDWRSCLDFDRSSQQTQHHGSSCNFSQQNSRKSNQHSR